MRMPTHGCLPTGAHMHRFSHAQVPTCRGAHTQVRLPLPLLASRSGTKSFKQLMEEADVPAGRKSGGGLPPPPVTSPRAAPAPPAAAAAAAANGSPAVIAAAPAAAVTAGKLPSLDPLVLTLQQVGALPTRFARLKWHGALGGPGARHSAAAACMWQCSCAVPGVPLPAPREQAPAVV